MGCGSSTPAGSEGKLSVDTGKNAVQAMTPTPSPKGKSPKKETLADEPMPEASTYTSNSPKTADSKGIESDNISISSYGSPVDTHRTHQQDLDPYNTGGQTKLLSPGYKMENETRRIGGFDPEAFRKANQPKANGGSQQQQWSSGQWNSNNDSSWAGGGNNTQQRENQNPRSNSRLANGNGNNHNNTNNTWTSPAAQTTYGGGSGSGAARGSDARESERWNKGDYIQSQDIFTTNAPQAMEQQQRMDIMDPHHDIMGVSSSHDDPFRSPGGMGHHQPARAHQSGAVNDDDDALMDDILGELDEL